MNNSIDPALLDIYIIAAVICLGILTVMIIYKWPDKSDDY